ncbi:MAG: FtsW/RodA/SpoVE family cell cycle protein [Candidatus Eisenbacteria bacterium]
MRDSGRTDTLLFGAVILICLFGLIMVYTSSVIWAIRGGHSETFFLRSQIGKFALGMVLLFPLSRLPYRVLGGPVARWSLAAAYLGMILTLTPWFSSTFNGTRRGLFGIQPAEFARIFLVLFLAYYAQKTESATRPVPGRARDWRSLLVPLGATLGLALLAKMQPNLSMAVMIAALGVGVLFASGQSILRLGAALLPVCLIVLAALKPYQLARIRGFQEHFLGNRGDGSSNLHWQVEQSLIALGSGGALGKGIGQGLQKFCYLPYSFSDFILGMVGEETGFLGVFILFTLFAIVLVRGFRIARRCPDTFGQVLAIGLTLNLALNFFLHSIVGLGLGPVTGVPLPFVSHGGSSLLANLVAIGLLLSISRSVRPEAEVRETAWSR